MTEFAFTPFMALLIPGLKPAGSENRLISNIIIHKHKYSITIFQNPITAPIHTYSAKLWQNLGKCQEHFFYFLHANQKKEKF